MKLIRLTAGTLLFLGLAISTAPWSAAGAQDEVEGYTLRYAPVDGTTYVYNLTTRGTSGESVVVNTESFTFDVVENREGSFSYTVSGEQMPENAPLGIRFQRALFPECNYIIQPDGSTYPEKVQPIPQFYNVPVFPDTPVIVGDTWSGGPVDVLPDMNVGAIPFTYVSTLTEIASFRGQQCVVIETDYSAALPDGAVSYMPFIGVVEGDQTEDQLGQGALVGGVVEDSAAREAGIEPGDLIIEAEGQKIRGWGGLEAIMPVIPPGQAVEFKVKRSDEELDIEITPVGVPLANISATGGLHSICYFSIETGIPLKIDIESIDLAFTLVNSAGESDRRSVEFSYILEYQRVSSSVSR